MNIYPDLKKSNFEVIDIIKDLITEKEILLNEIEEIDNKIIETLNEVIEKIKI